MDNLSSFVNMSFKDCNLMFNMDKNNPTTSYEIETLLISKILSTSERLVPGGL